MHIFTQFIWRLSYNNFAELQSVSSKRDWISHHVLCSTHPILMTVHKQPPFQVVLVVDEWWVFYPPMSRLIWNTQRTLLLMLFAHIKYCAQFFCLFLQLGEILFLYIEQFPQNRKIILERFKLISIPLRLPISKLKMSILSPSVIRTLTSSMSYERIPSNSS